ncbi:MAG: hypothetical protein HYT75_08390 [Deltaproteobacteria bacterium]|nr:hypothetical protein [Deltaproteobacteria bacterium]
MEPKKKIYLIALTVLVLLAIGVFFFSANQTEKTSENLEIFQEAPPIEVFSLASVISRVDLEQKLIFVQHPTEDKEIKVLVDDGAEIVKLEFPFDPKNPPSGGTTFSPKLTKIALGDLAPGSHALIESSENIYQKLELDHVKRIQILP